MNVLVGQDAARPAARSGPIARWARRLWLPTWLGFLGTVSTSAACARLSWAQAEPKNSSAAPVSWARASRMVMGTQVNLWVPGPQPAEAFDAFEKALVEMRRLEVLLTHHRRTGWPPSDLMRLQESAGQAAIPIAAPSAAVLQLAYEVADASMGAFDPTCAPLGQLWPTGNTAAAHIRRPTLAQRAAAAGRVDYHNLQVDVGAQRARLSVPGAALDLGGIAKGYILAAAAAVLRSQGLANFALWAGGDAVFAGHPPGATAWAVALRGPGGAQVAQLHLSDQALAVSGDDARYVWADGEAWHHIVDPRTQAPACGARLSAVVAADGALADALSAALFVSSSAASCRLMQRYPQALGLRLGADGQLWHSLALPLNYPLWPSKTWR